jgi:hypothetical protein
MLLISADSAGGDGVTFQYRMTKGGSLYCKELFDLGKFKLTNAVATVRNKSMEPCSTFQIPNKQTLTRILIDTNATEFDYWGNYAAVPVHVCVDFDTAVVSITTRDDHLADVLASEL